MVSVNYNSETDVVVFSSESGDVYSCLGSNLNGNGKSSYRGVCCGHAVLMEDGCIGLSRSKKSDGGVRNEEIEWFALKEEVMCRTSCCSCKRGKDVMVGYGNSKGVYIIVILFGVCFHLFLNLFLHS